jgi:hypothetical protein
MKNDTYVRTLVVGQLVWRSIGHTDIVVTVATEVVPLARRAALEEITHRVVVLWESGDESRYSPLQRLYAID